MTLTLLALGVIFLGGLLVVMWFNPPKLVLPQIVVNVELSKVLPEEFKLTINHLANSLKGLPGQDEPIPAEIVQYCDMESDEWARDARKRRVRLLRSELGTWELAFNQLQKEDAVG